MISGSCTEVFFPYQTDEEIERRISNLPDHLREIFERKVGEGGLSRRHALFIASSYDWGKKNEP